MNSDLELTKKLLDNANELIDVKYNPAVDSVLLAPVKAIPIIGNLIDSSANKLLEKYQKEKEQELINVILKEDNIITSEMVNNVEFIINISRVIEAVKRLATNDKVKFFGNLIRNGYLSGECIKNDLFEEYLYILNTMSFREIQYLIDYKLYCEGKSRKKTVISKNWGNNISYNRWRNFRSDYAKQKNISENELYSAFMRIKYTGFIDEDFETESGDLDEDSNSFSSLSVESTGFYLEKSFLKFYDLVLKIEEI